MFPSLLLKFKAWLRAWLMMDGPKQLSAGSEKPSSIKDGAAQLVDRARQGDQNAIALICQVRDNAQKKNPRAVKSFKALMKYVKQNPVTKTWSFGEETANLAELDSIAHGLFGGDEPYEQVIIEKVPELAAGSVNKAIVTLANGPSLMPEEGRFQAVTDSLSEQDKEAFMMGYKHGVKELESIPIRLQCPFLLGHILGTARRIQAIRLPDVPVSVLSPQVGAELGE